MRVFDYYAWRNFAFTPSDVFIGLFVLICILVFGFFKAIRKRDTNPLYKYYFPGLVVKLIGAIVFALVYALYYKDGGDTVAYWWGAESLKNLFYSNSSYYISEMFTKPSNEDYFNHYDAVTGWPPDWLYKSSRHFFVCKAVSVITIFIPGSFLGVSIFMGFIAYHGIWKLYETFTHHFPSMTKTLRIGILFLPSTLFWCSGIMKDTIVLAGVCWIVHETDLFLRPGVRKNRVRFILRLVIWGWLIVSCKPYVVIALAPAWLLWMNYTSLSKIKSTVLKYYLIPIVFVGSSIAIFQIYSATTMESEFSPDNVLDQAMVVRNDFATNVTYGNNKYKAAVVDKGGLGMVRVIPESIIAGLFMPFIWQARSPFILISSLENLFILGYFLYALIKLKIFGFTRFIRSHPLLLFSVVFSIILAFIVGFTSILFGVLIRFRTPFLPFFVSFIIITAGKIRSINVLTSYSIKPIQK